MGYLGRPQWGPQEGHTLQPVARPHRARHAWGPPEGRQPGPRLPRKCPQPSAVTVSNCLSPSTPSSDLSSQSVSQSECSKRVFLFQTLGPSLQDGGHFIQSAESEGASVEGAWRPRGDRCGGLAHEGGLGGGGAARPHQPVGAIPLKSGFIVPG